MSYEQLFLYALFLTLLMEVPVAFFIARYFYNIKDTSSIVFAGVITSMLTLPYFWFILPYFITERMSYIIIGESLIIIIEAYIYYKILKSKFKQAIFISLIANVVSILGGLLIF